jgi:hypothetical protein
MLRERLDDALRPEEARWHAALAITDFAARYVEGLRRPPPAEVAWDEARFRTAPHVRLVRCAWDWDGWLQAGGGAEPGRRTTRFAVHESGSGARLQPLAEPRSVAELAELVAEATGSSAADALSATVRQQIQQLYAAGLVDRA